MAWAVLGRIIRAPVERAYGMRLRSLRPYRHAMHAYYDTAVMAHTMLWLHAVASCSDVYINNAGV